MIADDNTRRHNRLLNLFFILVVAATLSVRVVVFLQYSMTINDTDQPIMWHAARDYAQGVFSEPRFYAQDYNTHMESFFAVPLLWLDVPVYYALPITTHFLFIFPYLFAAFYLFFKRKKIEAIALLSLALCMPAAFDLMNSISRGFVTGLFFATFFVINVLQPRRLGFLALNTALAVIGYYVTPISLLATLPLSFYFFLFNYKNPAYYKIVVLCLTLIVPLHFIFDQFYIDHPDYIVLGLRRTFSMSALWFNLSHLDEAFAHLSFFAERKSVLLLAAYTGLSILLYRGNKKAFWSFMIFLVILLVSFTMDKSLEGTNWLFGARSRLYLPVPFVLGLFLATLPLQPGRFTWLFAVPLLFAVYKMFNYEKLLAWHFDKKNHWGVIIVPLDVTLRDIETYKRACEEHQSGYLLVSGRFWLCTQVAYGGPAIHGDYPVTELTNTERRYRVRETNREKVFDRFVFISIRDDLHNKVRCYDEFKVRPIDAYGMYLVTNNQMKTGDFIELVNMVEEKDADVCGLRLSGERSK